MLINLWNHFLKTFPGRSRLVGRDRVARRRRAVPYRLESLENRVLLSAATVDVEAKLLGGSLILTGNAAGSRDVTIAPNAQNPGLIDVTPGVGTTVNGQRTPFQFPASQLRFNVSVTLNNGSGGIDTSHVTVTGLNLPQFGSVFLNLWGNGADTVAVDGVQMGGTLFLTTGSGNDQVTLSNFRPNGGAFLSTGMGSDTVTVQQSTFGGQFNLDGGLNGGDTVNVNDATFNGPFTANLWRSGNTINVEQDAALPGATVFNSVANFNYLGVSTRGGGGAINVGRQGPNTFVQFNSLTTFLAATVSTSVTNTNFGRFSPNFIFCNRVGVSITTTSLPDWTQNLPGYNQTITTMGGVGPLVFSVSAGTLPTGLALNPLTGVISGTPTVAGSSNFTIMALDSNGTFATQQYSIDIESAISLPPSPLPTWSAGVPYLPPANGNVIEASNGVAPYVLTVTNLVNPVTGLEILGSGTEIVTVNGTPENSGVITFTVTAVDSISNTVSQDYTLTINPAVSILTTTLPDWTTGRSYSQTIATTGGTAPLTFSQLSGTLPAGLSLSSAGVISGTPSAVGQSTFTVQVMDSVGSIDTQEYTVTINDTVSITTTSLPDWTLGEAYNETVETTGGTAPLTFSLTTGTLPDGLLLNSSTGAITGTPTTAGTSSFTVQVLDTAGATDTQAYTIVINGPVLITTTSLPDWTVGREFSQTIATSGGTSPLLFTVSDGILPSGLILDSSTGVLSGTPDVPGLSSFTIKVQDAAGASDTQDYTLTINDLVTITTTSLPDWTQNLAGYNETIATTGGTLPLTFSLFSGALPVGLELNQSTGAITGTPTTIETSVFSILVTDLRGSTDVQSYTVSINSPISFVTTSLSDWTVNQPNYSQTIVTTGGVDPLSFSVSEGVLPSGLTLNSATGEISGTPDTIETQIFTIQVIDDVGAMATREFTITINAQVEITTLNLPDWTVDQSYSQFVETSGGTSPLAFTLATGSLLPDGLILDNETGQISGIPTAVGLFTFTVEVVDAAGSFDSQDYTVEINDPLVITTETLPDWTQDHPGYSQFIETTGGTLPLDFSLTEGTIPPGLSIDPTTGEISGTPTVPGVYMFTVGVTDNGGASTSQAYTVTINDPLVVTTTTLVEWTEGVSNYLQGILTTGGTAPLFYSITGGALPAGLDIDPLNGEITGTPTIAGIFDFTVSVEDSAGTPGATATADLSITINPAVQITTLSLGDWTQDQSGYDQIVEATGGTGPLTYTLLAGLLPDGLSLDTTTGAITGTPTVAGLFPFTIQAEDSLGSVDFENYSVTINELLIITTVALPEWTVDATGYSAQIEAVGGTSPLTFSIVDGDLPDGLGINAISGMITGTPTVAGTFGFTVQVEDSAGNPGAIATQVLEIVINAPLEITTTSLNSWTVDQANYLDVVSTTGGTAPLQFSVASGDFPPGLTLNAGTGTISGQPTLAGSFDFEVQVLDAAGVVALRTLSIVINPLVEITTLSLPNWTQDHPGYTQFISTTGGTAPLTFSTEGGPLPDGLSLNTATGEISGTPTLAGLYSFDIRVVDDAGSSSVQSYLVTIADPLTIDTTSLPEWTEGIAGYSQAILTSGGTGLLTFSVIGVLPDSLTLNPSTGVISGTPSAAGSFDFTIQVEDSAGSPGAIATQPLSIVINPPVSITTTALSDWTQDRVVNFNPIETAGGTGTITFLLIGTLPTGLSFNPTTAVISGTPTVLETQTFTIQAEDSLGSIATQEYTMTINPPPSITTTSPLPGGSVGVAYSTTIGATGGTAPYFFTRRSGTLPPGLTLNIETGEISGTPTTDGTFDFQIQLTDITAAVFFRDFSITISL